MSPEGQFLMSPDTRGRMFQDRVLDLGGNPHPGASPVLLEVALVQTPDLGALNPLQPTEFF